MPIFLDAFLDIFIKGGIVLIPIFAASLLSWYLVLDRYYVLRRNMTPSKEEIKKLLDLFANEKKEDIKEQLKKYNGIYSSVFIKVQDMKNAEVDDILQSVDEIILSRFPKLTKWYDTIAVLGSAIPLLGILGTVTGMIHTFEMIQLFGSGNPVFMAGGISEALLTTQAGLIVTFPLLLALNFLQNRKDKLISDIEYTMSALLNIISKKRGSYE